MSDTPYSSPFDLGTLSEAPVQLNLAPAAKERAAIAAWLGVLNVPEFSATVRLSRMGGGLYVYEARYAADVVQACVVTLEPVPAHLEGECQRLFRLPPKRKPSRIKNAAPRHIPEAEITLEEEDGPELLPTPWLDLAQPVLEELSLNLDPYPRAPGVVFEVPEDEPEPKDNPFAVLETLKPQGAPKPGKTKGKG